MFKECAYSDAMNTLFKKEGKWYMDVPPERLVRTINYGTYLSIKPYKFLIGPIHESAIRWTDISSQKKD